MRQKAVTVAGPSSVILDEMFRFRTLVVSALVVSGVFINAQSSRPSARSTSAETGLVGIKLYDTGTRVVNVYGSPDEILALSLNSQGGGGGGGANGGGGGGGSSTGAQAQQTTLGTTDTPGKAPTMIGDPFGTGDTQFRQLRQGADGTEGEGAPARRGTDAGGGGGETSGGGGGGSSDRVVYTRWVYKRANAHYGFVFDKFNRVVQIEALGLKDSKVRTRKGITFDMHFNDLIKRYGAPDAYEINGDNIVVRYLVKDRVAFRLSRTRPNTPHHVTGVVVAAGKA